MQEFKTVMGIDISTVATGWAVLDMKEVSIHCGTIPVTAKIKRDEALMSDLDVYNYIVNYVDEIVSAYDIDLVCIEDTFVGINKKTSKKLIQLGAIVRYLFHRSGIPVIDVSPTALKKYATGSGKSGKKAMCEAVEEVLGFETKDDNVADSILCAMYGCREVMICKQQLAEMFSIDNE